MVFVVGTISLKAAGDITIERGTVLETSQPVKLRASPPEQKWIIFVKEPGEKIGRIEEGKKVEVEAIKEVKRPLSTDIWLKVVTKDNKETTESGWVYYGTDKEASNFKLMKSGETP
jgi:hypothetical protein